MKSLTQIIGAIVLSSFLGSCNKPPETPELKNFTFISKYGGVIRVDRVEYFKSIHDFEREVIANLHLRPKETSIPEEYPKLVLDIYSKNNESVRTFVDYGYSSSDKIVDEYWDGTKFMKRNNDNEEEFKKHDQEYLQLLDLLNFKERVAKKMGDYP